MKKAYRNRRPSQGGFSLIEILIVLSLLTLLATAITVSFDGSRSRAQVLISTMHDLASANQRLKNDTGCYVKTPQALFDSAKATPTTGNFCGTATTKTWRGPYINRVEVDNNGLAVMDKVGADVTLEYVRDATAAGGKAYYVQANKVPIDVAKQYLIECNGSDTSTGTTSDYTSTLGATAENKCFIAAADKTKEIATIYYLFDETK